ncbi:MAG TPA: FecR domain-containing protein [Thermoanaerobaculia bacterium]|nr:FecR domain-containing protein [Thermoanaerobaculia bacterium]
MARQREDSGPVIEDWYLISIHKLRAAGLVVLVILLGAGAYFYRDLARLSPRQKAENAIIDAEQALNDLAATPDFASFRASFDKGQQQLDEAKQYLGENQFEQAEAAAIESQTVVRAALAKVPGEIEADAQFLTVEGDVQFQKGGGSWQRGDVRTKLSNGDWVKTGGGASAEVIFANGSLYTIGPNALLEIFSSVNPQTKRKQNSVQMRIGTIEVNTADDSSSVQTRGTEVVVASASTAQVDVRGEGKPTEVAALRGSSTVRSPESGAQVTLDSGHAVTATEEGALSPVRILVDPPRLLSPADNQVIAASAGTIIELNWNDIPQAARYRLQVSRSRLFSTTEIQDVRQATSAKAKLTGEGAFYWRVASIGGDGEPGPYSATRRFRVTGIGSGPARAAERDTTPPALRLKRPFNVGGQFYLIEGQAEAGASVILNEQEISVEPDGSFRKLISFDQLGWNTVVVKAVDPAGNTSVQNERVLVEE